MLHRGGQCTYPFFPGVLLTSSPYNILSKPLTAFPHVTVDETTDSIERGMNPLAMTLINPLKEYWPSPGIGTATCCPQLRNAADRGTGALLRSDGSCKLVKKKPIICEGLLLNKLCKLIYCLVTNDLAPSIKLFNGIYSLTTTF